MREIVTHVTIRSELTTSTPVELSSESEDEQETPIKREPVFESVFKEGRIMDAHEKVPVIRQLWPSCKGILPQPSFNIKLMPMFYGLKNEDAYSFLHEFIKIFRI